MKYTWLEYKEKNAMFCELCLGALKTNAFTVGCSNFRTSMLERHDAHSDHQVSIVAKSMEGSMARAVAAAPTVKERAVDAAMKAVYWLCMEGIATQKYSSLLSLLELLNTPYVQELRCSENATYTSGIITNEMQDATAEVIKGDITKEIQESPSISILADESTDIMCNNNACSLC